MAWDPCVSCGREFHGNTQFNYVTWYIGDERFAYRLRHCEDCSANLRTEARGQGDKRDAQGVWQPSPLVAERQNGSSSSRPPSAPGAGADRPRPVEPTRRHGTTKAERRAQLDGRG